MFAIKRVFAAPPGKTSGFADLFFSASCPIPVAYGGATTEKPLCLVASPAINPHLLHSLSLRRKIIWDVRARASFFGRPSTLPERGYRALWASRTPLGLPPERDPDFDSRKQHRRSPAEIFRNKMHHIVLCAPSK